MMRFEAGLFQEAEVLFFSLMWCLLGDLLPALCKGWNCSECGTQMSRNVSAGASG